MINYDLRKIRGIVFDVDGVLSPSTIPMSEDGVPVRMVNIKDGYAMQLAVKKGIKIAIITGAHNEAVKNRYHTLGVKDVFIAASVKLPVLREWMAANGLEPEEVAFCGDDIPDVPCMNHVGLAIAPADAAVEALEAATYISPRDGGYGVGRDIIEQTMRAQGIWLSDNKAFGW